MFAVRSWRALVAAIGLNLAASHVAAADPQRHPVLIYYANETTQQATRSQTYAVLLSALAESRDPAAARLAYFLAQDARVFPEAVQQDEADLKQAAARRGFALAVFTNTLAQAQSYVFVPDATGVPELRRLPDLPPTANEILAASPLARGDFLRAALMTVADTYPPGSVDAILITNTHGGGDLALIPRVFADLSHAAPADVLAEFEGTPRADTTMPGPATAQGVTKLDYWRAIAEVGAARGMRFPLVFRQACDSGVSSWAEFRSLPANVGAIAHTATGRISYRDIDYAKVFEDQDLPASAGDRLAEQLRRRGIHVDEPGDMWKWLIRDAAIATWPYLAFLPLALWLVWHTWPYLLAGARRVGRATRSHG